MCGIVAYIGKEPALPRLMHGLKRLEYRGYDSAGVALAEANGLRVTKASGKLRELETKLAGESGSSAMVGIGHTRWATHGEPSVANAHPHIDHAGRIAVVHNGVIENFRELRRALKGSGCVFRSETDTEVIPMLIGKLMAQEHLTLSEAVKRAVREFRGAFAFVALDASDPSTLVAVRQSSPLILGPGQGEMFVASGEGAIVSYTKDAIRLNDGEIAVVRADGHQVFTFDDRPVQTKSAKITSSEKDVEKNGYPHFMLKEIMQQHEAVSDTLRGRLDMKNGTAVFGMLRDEPAREDLIRRTDRIILLGCGTSYHAALYGKLVIEELSGIPVDVELANEFATRKAALTPNTIAFAVSQSGETADTLRAIRELKQRGVPCFGIVNVVGSAIAHECGSGIYTHAGPEIGVASTKAFLCQCTVFALLALSLGRMRGMSLTDGVRFAEEMRELPTRIMQFLESDHARLKHYAEKGGLLTEHVFFLGRKYGLPVALEAALKMKEVSYLHAEALAAGELKHGPLALIDERVLTVLIAPNDGVYEKNRLSAQEIRTRKGPILEFTDHPESSHERTWVHHVAGARHEALNPLLYILPLQLFAYYASVARGIDPDQPRNIAKSSTTE